MIRLIILVCSFAKINFNIILPFSHMSRSPMRPLACRVQVKLLVQFISAMRSKCAANLFLFDLIAVGVTDQEVSGYTLLSILDISYT
jgi:hypothetical protein